MGMVLRRRMKASVSAAISPRTPQRQPNLRVGFNHFFKAKSGNYGGDMVLVQPHAAPGVYARAFLEGRLSATQLRNFRRELEPGGGLCSYPHPRSMPDFWQMQNPSMGLSTPSAIYQARFAKYLEHRGLKTRERRKKSGALSATANPTNRKSWARSNIAAREGLDNLVLVVNCNLQRLDGPVRGNGKIIRNAASAAPTGTLSEGPGAAAGTVCSRRITTAYSQAHGGMRRWRLSISLDIGPRATRALGRGQPPNSKR